MSVTTDATALAGRALLAGEPLRALSLVGREESPLGLALRGIAYAQVGDLDLARDLLVRARASTKDRLLRARAGAALVEIELEAGAAAVAARAAEAAAKELESLGDVRNAAVQRLVGARAEVLLGRLGEARRIVDAAAAGSLPPDVRAIAALAHAEIAIRSVAAMEARAALVRARAILEGAPNQVLARALVALEEELSRPLARIAMAGATRGADLYAVEEVSNGQRLLVDACRLLARGGRVTVPLARRPVLFALLFGLARAWPASVPRDTLAAEAFATRRVNASHRMRLRVEIGRLRKAIEDLGAAPVARDDGYALTSEREVALLLPAADDDTSRIALLLSDGAAWTVRGLAEHAGVSRSTVQRALRALVESGGAIRTGAGKEIRYARPGRPIASRMLLLGLVPRP